MFYLLPSLEITVWLSQAESNEVELDGTKWIHHKYVYLAIRLVYIK